MAEAFLLGAIAQVSLLLSGLVATWVTIPTRIVGWLGAFGAGALISAVAFDLTAEALDLGPVGVTIWLLVGAGVFIVGDYVVDGHIGPSGAESGALGIVLGSIVDGVPESLIFGIALSSGAGSAPRFSERLSFRTSPRPWRRRQSCSPPAGAARG